MINPDHLWLNDYLNDNAQIIPRCYTFISHFEVEDLFLCINKDFMFKTLIKEEDRILAEWTTFDDINYFCYIYVPVDSHEMVSEKRNQLLLNQIVSFIDALKKADELFLNQNPLLLYSSIYVFFHSKTPQLDRIEHWGCLNNY